MKSPQLKFPVFFSLTKRRIKHDDLQTLYALFPKIINELGEGKSFPEALDKISPSTANANYGILLDISAGRFQFDPPAARRTSDVISHRQSVARKLEKELRALVKSEKPIDASPFTTLEKLL